MAPVERLNVALALASKRLRYRARLWGGSEQVYVIAHKDVGMQRNVCILKLTAQEREVMRAVIVVDKDRCAVHATLGDV